MSFARRAARWWPPARRAAVRTSTVTWGVRRSQGLTTILLGDRSGPMLTGIAGTWVGRQPGSTVLPLRGQGHTAYMDASAYVAERIQAALGG